MGENMNVEKIFNRVKEDEMNSPLISICGELEKQGYKVKVESVVLYIPLRVFPQL
jgi:hypothetical protein